MLSKFHLTQVIRHLKNGGILLHPTESVWGFACDANNLSSIERLLSLKQRQSNKGFILLSPSESKIQTLLQSLTPIERERVLSSWPGPYTWLLPKNNQTLLNSSQLETLVFSNFKEVAIRISAHQLTQQIVSAFGNFLISTSANISGRPPAKNYIQALKLPKHESILLLSGKTSGNHRPTQICRINGEIIRP